MCTGNWYGKNHGQEGKEVEQEVTSEHFLWATQGAV